MKNINNFQNYHIPENRQLYVEARNHCCWITLDSNNNFLSQWYQIILVTCQTCKPKLWLLFSHLWKRNSINFLLKARQNSLPYNSCHSPLSILQSRIHAPVTSVPCRMPDIIFKVKQVRKTLRYLVINESIIFLFVQSMLVLFFRQNQQ